VPSSLDADYSSSSSSSYEPYEKPSNLSKSKSRGIIITSAALLLALTCFAAGFFLGNAGKIIQHPPGTGSRITTSSNSSSGNKTCDDPPTRREWRSLSTDERRAYTDAVRCLTTRPSRQLPQDSLYDDIAYVHIDTGAECKSPFCCLFFS
jgi:tyrosinase